MINRVMNAYHQNRFLESHRFLLVYAHIIAFIHGVGFITQGTYKSNDLIKYALTNTHAWHGGLPAISIFNSALLSGICIVLITAVSLVLIIQRPQSIGHWPLLGALFLSGGGFVFLFIAGITRLSLSIERKQPNNLDTALGRTLIFILFVWLFTVWGLGWVIPYLMLKISLFLFFFFDIAMPISIIVIHRHHRSNSKPQHFN